jgi:hypothetical protein
MESLQARVYEHQEKIGRERAKHQPDEGLINHWETEIRAFRKAMDLAKKRLGAKI